MIVKHFSALTMCPYGAFTLGDAKEMVCHCLVVETKNGLVVVDSGLFAEADFTGPSAMRTPGYFLTLMRVARDESATAARGLEALGYRTKDVRHVVCTHLDLDHAGGIADFPDAMIHVMEAERKAAESPPTAKERRRYIEKHFAHHPQWTTHVTTAGEKWMGFDAVRALDDGEPDLLLVPLAGHTRGHAAVAVRASAGWLLHCGDAYFHRDEMTTGKAPFGFDLFQRTVATDDDMRKDNQRRLRELKARQSEIELFCAHSKYELERLQGGTP